MTQNTPRSRRPTIYDVATTAGVSPSLVSLVLQNPSKVSEKRRKAVQTAMSELGYRPSRAATTLASSQTKSIGLVIDDYRNLWFVDLIRGMESALSPHGYQVTLADSRPGENRITEAADGLLAMHVEGLVIAAEPSESVLAGTWVPAVVAGWRNEVPAAVDLITNDDDGGGRMAAEHLLSLGHTHIGHASGSGGAASHRREGFQLDSAILVLSPGSWGSWRHPRRTATLRPAGSWTTTPTPPPCSPPTTPWRWAPLEHKARGLSVPGDLSVSAMTTPRWPSRATWT